MQDRGRSLLGLGHDGEWDLLEARKRAVLTPPPQTPIDELLRRGQHLSAQAAMLVPAVSPADERARP